MCPIPLLLLPTVHGNKSCDRVHLMENSTSTVSSTQRHSVCQINSIDVLTVIAFKLLNVRRNRLILTADFKDFASKYTTSGSERKTTKSCEGVAELMERIRVWLSESPTAVINIQTVDHHAYYRSAVDAPGLLEALPLLLFDHITCTRCIDVGCCYTCLHVVWPVCVYVCRSVLWTLHKQLYGSWSWVDVYLCGSREQYVSTGNIWVPHSEYDWTGAVETWTYWLALPALHT